MKRPASPFSNFKITALLLFLLPALSVAASPVSKSLERRDTVLLKSLPDAERLITLRDSQVIVAPNPYYQSTLARILPIMLVNRKAPMEKPQIDFKNAPLKENLFGYSPTPLSLPYEPTRLKQFLLGRRIDKQNLDRVAMSDASLLNTPYSELEGSRVEVVHIASETPALGAVAPDLQIAETGLETIKLGRRYWKFGWESIVQFSQNYISKNWHKGGGSNLNLYNKQLLRYDYNREKVSWTNELEWRLSAYTSEADTVSKYRVADDLLRFYTNFGLQAYENLFYTLGGEVKTSLFTRREENKTEVLSALFSPLTVNVGLGMKYVIDHKFTSHFGRRLKLMINLSPLAYDFRWSYKTEGINLRRHGFLPGTSIYSALGSNLRVESVFDFSPTISWQSRLNYNTSYKRVEIEWENGLDFAISRFFSTRLNVVLRYDDAVPITPQYPSRLQINEVFSLGFRFLI